MTKLGKSLMVVVAIGALIVGLSCCRRKQGPAERAGRQVDKAVENAERQVEKAGEKIEDAAKDTDKN